MATIEQKAKAYDEAIERAKKWYNAPNSDKMPTYANRVIGEIFPELRESEDERVRKEIMEYVKNTPVAPEGHIEQRVLSRWIAWLEKQGNQNHIEQNLEMVEALRTEYEKGRADTIAEMRKKLSDGKKSVISLLESLRLKED